MRFLIKEWRQARGLTQQQLASYLGISPATLSRYETGRTVPNLALGIDLAKVLQIPISMLSSQDRAAMVHRWLHDYWPEDLHEIARQWLETLEVGDPDTPLEGQRISHLARALRAWSDMLWYILVSRQAAADQESARLLQALRQPPAAPQAGTDADTGPKSS